MIDHHEDSHARLWNILITIERGKKTFDQIIATSMSFNVTIINRNFCFLSVNIQILSSPILGLAQTSFFFFRMILILSN